MVCFSLGRDCGNEFKGPLKAKRDGVQEKGMVSEPHSHSLPTASARVGISKVART